jgi:hypothetical protein
MYVIEVETFVTRAIRPFTSDTAEESWWALCSLLE